MPWMGRPKVKIATKMMQTPNETKPYKYVSATKSLICVGMASVN